ncbi:MAG: DUF3604 domain-containing protein, partial [Robiginitalea sp.]
MFPCAFPWVSFCLSTLILTACQDNPKEKEAASEVSEAMAETAGADVQRFPMKKVFWGDTHHHTALSGDAFGGGTRLNAEDSYRLALGETLKSNTGQTVKMKRPLDFLCITDHAEGFGVFIEIDNGNPVLMTDSIARRWNELLQGGEEEAKQLAVEIPYAMANNKLP